MKPKQIMVIAGEPSGDILAAELVPHLRRELMAAEIHYSPDPQPLRTGLEPRFFGAGGPRMAKAGVDLAFDLTEHSVVGLVDVFRHYLKFRRLFRRLYALAIDRRPDAIVCVDFSGFNRRFAHAIKRYVRTHRGWFMTWNPRLIQYVSPQVWASRSRRAVQIARDYDLVLSLFPFEKAWYAQRVPQLEVQFVGHPMLDRFAARASAAADDRRSGDAPQVLLLPGSRPAELRRHLPVLNRVIAILRRHWPGLQARAVLPNESLAAQARTIGLPADIPAQAGDLEAAFGGADLALASTGTVTMECARFGVPAVTLYKTSWLNYHIARRIVKVKWLTMPNLLANEEVFPEFVQHAATPENIAAAARELLRDESRRQQVKTRLRTVIDSLGGPGANQRAAQAIVRLLRPIQH